MGCSGARCALLLSHRLKLSHPCAFFVVPPGRRLTVVEVPGVEADQVGAASCDRFHMGTIYYRQEIVPGQCLTNSLQLLHTNGIINIIGETAMKVLETTKDGATVQLTKEEVRLIGSLSLEVFHGAFRLECKTLWQTVAMPIPFKRAAEIMHQFQDLFRTIIKMK